MRLPRTSVYFHSPTANPQAVPHGLGWLRAVGQQAPGKRKALFAVRAKADLTSHLAGVVAAATIEQFKKSEHLQVGSIQLQLMTLRTGPSYWNGPVLAVDPARPNASGLAVFLDQPPRGLAVQMLPHQRPAVRAWRPGTADVPSRKSVRPESSSASRSSTRV